jgi:hypothetical protein
MFLIAAALAAATAVPAYARATESAPEPEHQAMQMPSVPDDANVAAGAGLRPAPEAAPVVEARARQRR